MKKLHSSKGSARPLLFPEKRIALFAEASN